ncbi:6207_t:CDS:2, partial [Scutellospora calospora]
MKSKRQKKITKACSNLTDKSEEVINKLNEKVKGIGIEEETNVLKNIQRKKLTDIENLKKIDEIAKKKSRFPENTET